jgi:hypothetical protein
MAAGKIAHSAQHLAEFLVNAGTNPAAGTPGDGTTTALRTQVAATIPTALVTITGVVTVTVNGAQLGDIVLVGQQGAVIAGVGAYGGYVSAADTVTLYAVATTGGYTGASKTYNILVLKQN